MFSSTIPRCLRAVCGRPSATLYAPIIHKRSLLGWGSSSSPSPSSPPSPSPIPLSAPSSTFATSTPPSSTTSDVEAAFATARQMFLQGNAAAALPLLDNILKRDPYHLASVYLKVEALIARQRFQEALEIVDRMLLQTPQSLEMMTLKGTCLQHLQRFDEAADLFEAVLRVSPAYIPALVSKGSICVVKGQLDVALQCFDMVIGGVETSYFVSLLNKGVILSQQKKFEEALVMANKALSISSQQPAMILKANTLLSLGRWQESSELYDQVLKKDPSNAWAQSHKQVADRMIELGATVKQ